MQRDVAAANGLRRQNPKRAAQDDAFLVSDPPPRAPRPWKCAPTVAALICIGFLMLQILPATHYRLPNDRTRTWIPFDNPSIKLRNTSEDTREYINLFICTDERDFRPIFVVINSTLSNTRYKERIHFHIITAEEQQQVWHAKLRSLLPSANVDIVSEKIDLEAIKKQISFRKDSKAREALTSPYNFLPFYLPHIFPHTKKLIYLDSDVVVKGDIEELYSMDLEGHAVAAVEDCSQKFSMYFNFELLNRIQRRETGNIPWIPRDPFDPKTCIFNRGVLVIDTAKWIEQNLTVAIEWWMEQFHRAERTLYRYGVSQPPFLLALANKYKKLDTVWNTRGLGRSEFSELERDYMSTILHKRPARSPFLSPNSDNSKILHFNGKFKPWLRDRVLKPHEKPASLCGSKHEDCAQLWWSYISPTISESLKPIQ